MKKQYHMNALRSAYLSWRSNAGELDCGFSLAREIRARSFSRLEKRCMKHAQALRDMGENVPPVPGEPDFR